MELGLAGRRAIVCGSSRGLGRACAEALIAEGARVVLNGRDPKRLAQTAAELSDRGEVAAIAADLDTEAGRETLLAACPEPDILITNNGGPSPRFFADIDEAGWTDALAANMIAPLMLIRAVLPAMRARAFGRIVNITSAMVTTPRPHMVLSAGARAGLTAALKGLALEVARDNVTINNLLPERFDTDRQHFMAEQTAKREGISYDAARAAQRASIAARRLGRPEEFGAMCAFLCSDLAGYISGQNLHLDGGSYPALV
jgi:3-oxoacyl-[acyl-carrier protein] reductase